EERESVRLARRGIDDVTDRVARAVEGSGEGVDPRERLPAEVEVGDKPEARSAERPGVGIDRVSGDAEVVDRRDLEGVARRAGSRQVDLSRLCCGYERSDDERGGR